LLFSDFKLIGEPHQPTVCLTNVGVPRKHRGAAQGVPIYLNSPAYESGFDTVAETWVTVRVPFRDFVPTFRGRRLRNMPAIDGNDIRQIGFMLAEKQAGPFRLEIDWIRAYEDTPQRESLSRTLSKGHTLQFKLWRSYGHDAKVAIDRDQLTVSQ
jgi:hypothetical protein